MKFLVSCKKVTDPDMKIVVNSKGDGIVLDDAVYEINPFDEIAIEEAIKNKERGDDEVEIVLITIGDENSIPQIRKGLAMGADRAILVDVENYENLDSDSISNILEAVYDLEEPDIFLMGKQSIDNDASQVPQLLAENLDLPQATFASKIEIDDDEAIVTREVDGGLETIRVELPAVISVDLRLNEPRYPSLPNMRKAKKKEIKKLTLEDLEVELEEPKVIIKRLIAPPVRKGGIKVSSVEELFDKLKNEAKVL